jgi:ABC-type glycerol-3-phosphate transport system substrate-binding protein
MRRATGAVLAVLLLTAACGGGDEEPEAAAPAEDAPTLQAMVGTEDSPDAFEISLVDEDGEPVTTLPAGEYNIEVDDPTSVHNFHLSGGDGAVDEKTTATEKVETTWVVTFEPGEYRYICDPHPSMNGQFTVT